MIVDRKKITDTFLKWIEENGTPDEPGFDMKKTHTMRVAVQADEIARALQLDQEDIDLAWLIGILHDIGRFHELKISHTFDGSRFDHAGYGAKLLFDEGVIRAFIDDDTYDNLIRKAIENHSRLAIEDGLDERTLLHARIIRDADKLDNLFTKLKEPVWASFPGKGFDEASFQNSGISEEVMASVRKCECVKLKDRKEPLDYYICVLAFVFDLNFACSRSIAREKQYIGRLCDKIFIKNEKVQKEAAEIRSLLDAYINS